MVKEKENVTKDMTLGDVITKHPEAAEVMIKFGLHCVGCHVAAWETIEQGAKSHGMSDKDLEKMVREINDAVKDKNK